MRDFPMLGGVMGKTISQSGIEPTVPIYIAVAADFPTVAEADDNLAQVYIASSNVTDNDPTKTNTGQSFNKGEQFRWDGSSYIVTDTTFWVDDGTDIKTISNPRNIDMQGGGFKDAYVPISITLGSATATALNTTAQSIVGSINELNDKAHTVSSDVDDIVISSAQESAQAFDLPYAPFGFSSLVIFRNGLKENTDNYTLSGLTVNWLSGAGINPLAENDNIGWFFNFEGSSSPSNKCILLGTASNGAAETGTGSLNRIIGLEINRFTDGFSYEFATGEITCNYSGCVSITPEIRLAGITAAATYWSIIITNQTSGYVSYIEGANLQDLIGITGIPLLGKTIKMQVTSGDVLTVDYRVYGEASDVIYLKGDSGVGAVTTGTQISFAMEGLV